MISIHALRGEGDDSAECHHDLLRISIHALRGEGDTEVVIMYRFKDVFQSTPSVGRATRTESEPKSRRRDFNPRPPWGGRRYACAEEATAEQKFQSTPSVGRATLMWFGVRLVIRISIHALRGEGDHSF